MTMLNRRSVLKTGAAGLFSTMASGPVLARHRPGPVFVVLSGLNPDMPLSTLRNFLSAFALKSIPFVLPIDVSEQGFQPGDKSAPLLGYIARLTRELPEICEVSLHIQGITANTTYFRGRRAASGRSEFYRLFAPHDATGQIAEGLVTITDSVGNENQWLRGLRPAGFRNLIQLPTSPSRTQIGTPDGDITWFRGGISLHASVTPSQIRQQLAALHGRRQPTVVNFKVDGLETISAADRRSVSEVLTDEIVEGIGNSRITPELPGRFPLAERADSDRFVTVVLDMPQEHLSAPQIARFLRRAQTAGLHIELQAGSGGTRGASAACMIADLFPTPGAQLPDCTISPTRKLIGSANDWRWSWASPGSARAGIGPDGDLILGQSVTLDRPDAFDHFSDHTGPSRDLVIFVKSAALPDDTAADRLLRALSGLADTPGNQLVSLSQRLTRLTPIDPIHDKFRREANLRPALRPRSEEKTTRVEEALLRRDAALAFTYLTAFRKEASGLLPTTVTATGTTPVTYDRITMWDVGSLLLGLHAARALGLLTGPRYRVWAKQIITNLPEVDILGLTLPASQVASDTGAPHTRDFNVCDTGRLLSAFHILRDDPGLEPVIMDKLARWELGGVLIDGQPHSILSGQLRALTVSQCAHYTARAFAQFGYDAKSPLDIEMEPSEEADWKMRILTTVSEIGLLGAEPLLLEPTELGWSPQSRYLADILFCEQVHTYARTGDLICVSEGPINHSPWFTYQGLNLGSETERWGVEVISDRRRFDTDRFKRSVANISTKSAYLWNALHPHPYSTLLKNHARTRGRIEGLGFASAIFHDSGQPTHHYSDLNTNAVILQAIARTLDRQR